ncbi:hypothetical protein F443_07852 [Phytophthora nicotianae P1569]|uniref:Uncharacterized protein n=1 Tax=Phytophthora nicotianae P1569 TaxID=1317065 RepID=V9FCD4_PHYNI|nr:hypothetical protein F443_07852 [Phytophthora nicotianae P1569]
MGLLRPGVAIQEAKPGKGDYGAAYARRDNAGAEYHGSQKAIQIRYKEFAQACGFQLVVDHFSAKGPGGGNAKYVCKKLNGQQFYDKEAPEQDIRCPFSMIRR